MSPHEFLDALGYWVCHQDPGRTLVFEAMRLPLCIRCTGLYLFMGLALWCGLLAPPPGKGWRPLLLAVGAALAGSGVLLAQWIGAQMGIWHSNVANRLLTGFAAGAGLGWLLHAAFSMRFRGGPSEEQAVHPGWARHLAAPVAFVLSSTLSLILLFTQPPWPLVGWMLGAASLAGFFSASGWGIAVVLSYAMRDSSGNPRKVIIAAVTTAAVLLQAALMTTIRL